MKTQPAEALTVPGLQGSGRALWLNGMAGKLQTSLWLTGKTSARV